MTALIPCQPVTLKGSSECLCSLLALVTLVPRDNIFWAQLNTQAGALARTSHGFTVRRHSGHQAEPHHASMPSPELSS